MANLVSLDQKSLNGELDKLNDKSVPEESALSTVALVLFSVVPMVILIILFMT